LQRESSDIDGPKPILLENFKNEDLMAMIIGHSETRNPTFGCNQVIIVRDQETKSTLPFFLKQALCLTVYEAKGLEFDDVILYNFFSNSPAGNQYRILRDIEICRAKRRKLQIEEQLTINELDYNQFKKRIKVLEEEAKVHEGEEVIEEELEEYTYFNVIRDRSDILRNFSSLCNDLKHLYVSITRPKSRLLIYDQDESNRGAIKQYWEECGVIDIVSKGQEKDHPILKYGFEALADEASSKDEWRTMGINLFRKKFYMSAASCFENSEDEDLKHRCYAYYHADSASSFNSEADTLLYAATNNKNLKKNERTQKRTEAKKLKLKANEDYFKAGDMFEKIQLYKQAAQCFYTTEEYKKAADLFIKVEMFPQAAECFMITKDYSKAAEMFEESNLILKALQCYEYLRDWEKILLCLNRNKHKFKENQRESLINKYVPIALNSIFRMLNSGDSEENRGKALEEKYFKDIPHIVEEQSEESEEDEPEITEVEGQQVVEEEHSEEEKEKTVDEIKEEETKEETKEEAKDQKFESDSEEEVIETGKKKEYFDDSSFTIISKADFEDDFEHLSNFDPEDEFLNSNRSLSVVGSVILKNRNSRPLESGKDCDLDSIASYSEFSVISGSRASAIINMNTIQTDRDIYIEDIAMQKIIYYVSLFSEEAKNYLHKLRSKKQLAQETADFTADTFELELDNISVDLVKILLDVLESFDMFRLCMIVCNRYNVTEHLSRYLTSVCYKYSNLKLLPILSVLQVNLPLFRQKQSQVSILANEAIHNMFSLVSPDMIKQYKTEDLPIKDKNSMSSWRFLFYLGFWKKLVYILDSEASLQLCYSIGDFYNFKIVYMVHYRSELEDEEIKNLAEDKCGQWIGVIDRNSKIGIL
jgi:hypothetical protein